MAREPEQSEQQRERQEREWHCGDAADSSPSGRFLAVSTRKLILYALLCGLVILVAFTVQVVMGRF